MASPGANLDAAWTSVVGADIEFVHLFPQIVHELHQPSGQPASAAEQDHASGQKTLTVNVLIYTVIKSIIKRGRRA